MTGPPTIWATRQVGHGEPRGKLSRTVSWSWRTGTLRLTGRVRLAPGVLVLWSAVHDQNGAQLARPSAESVSEYCRGRPLAAEGRQTLASVQLGDTVSKTSLSQVVQSISTCHSASPWPPRLGDAHAGAHPGLSPLRWSFNALSQLMDVAVGGPQPGVARQGRELQRYGENGERLVAGCIPVRVLQPGTSKQRVEILLISSRGGEGLVIPKGGWETDESVEDAAARETVEEAGVRGTLEIPIVGLFPFISTKTARLRDAPRGCIAHVFAMHVAEELPSWPEAGQRRRTWVPAEEACQMCRHEWMRQAMQCWLKRQACQGNGPTANGGPVISSGTALS